MTNNFIYRRNIDIETADIGNEIGMINVENGKYYCLNEIGSAIWICLESPKSVDEIVQRLLELFNVDESTCKRETMIFIEDLINKGIICEV